MDIRAYIRIVETFQKLDALVAEAVGPFDPDDFIERIEYVYNLSSQDESPGDRSAAKAALVRLKDRANIEADKMTATDREMFLKRVDAAIHGKEKPELASNDGWKVFALARQGFQCAGVATKNGLTIIFSGPARSMKFERFHTLDDAIKTFKHRFQNYTQIDPENAGWVYNYLPQ